MRLVFGVAVGFGVAKGVLFLVGVGEGVVVLTVAAGVGSLDADKIGAGLIITDGAADCGGA